MNVILNSDYIFPLRELEGSIVLLKWMEGFKEIITYTHNL